jgi:hypothetical protein
MRATGDSQGSHPNTGAGAVRGRQIPIKVNLRRIGSHRKHRRLLPRIRARHQNATRARRHGSVDNELIRDRSWRKGHPSLRVKGLGSPYRGGAVPAPSASGRHAESLDTQDTAVVFGRLGPQLATVAIEDGESAKGEWAVGAGQVPYPAVPALPQPDCLQTRIPLEHNAQAKHVMATGTRDIGPFLSIGWRGLRQFRGTKR